MQCLPLESATNEHADIESTTGWNQSPVVWSSSGTPVGNLDDLTVAAGGWCDTDSKPSLDGEAVKMKQTSCI